MARYKTIDLQNGSILKQCPKCKCNYPLTDKYFYKANKPYITRKGNPSIVSTFLAYCKECQKLLAIRNHCNVTVGIHTIIEELNLALEQVGINWGEFVKEWNVKKGWYDPVGEKFVVRGGNRKIAKKYNITYQTVSNYLTKYYPEETEVNTNI